MEEQCDRLMRECEMCGHIPSMPSIHLPSIDWRTVLLILTDARDNERFGYLDHIIDSIDNQLAEQEY